MAGQTLETGLTKLLGIKYPIMCAGMGGVTMRDLVAAVSNAGGIGTVGAIGLSPDGLREEIREIRKRLEPGRPYGIDLLLPQVGGNARKTNKAPKELGALVDVMVEERVPLFVCAVGVPPRWVCDKLHAAGTVVMNMIGAPKHAPKALASGVDIICAQGTEGGGHTGAISTLVLVPQVADYCARYEKETGKRVLVTAAGGVFDGRGLAACLALGASGVWCGTRFLASPEANASRKYKERIVASSSADTDRTLIFSGRPMRVIANDYTRSWLSPDRQKEIADLTGRGIVPRARDMALERKARPKTDRPKAARAPYRPGYFYDQTQPSLPFDPNTASMLAGQTIGGVNDIKPAKDIVRDMMEDACRTVKSNYATLAKL